MSLQNLTGLFATVATQDVAAVKPLPGSGKSAGHEHTEPVATQTAPPATPQRIREAVQQLDAFVKSSGRTLEFRVDDKSGHVVVSVHNAATGEVIRQIPNEETLRIAERLAPDSSSVVLDAQA